MSEYQFYEFQAVDRPLTAQQVSELRRYSSRARITSTSFVNEYSFGNFKGDVANWLEEYFDAYLHVANWGTRELRFSLPSRLIDVSVARNYCRAEAVIIGKRSDRILLSLGSDGDGDGDWIEAEGLLASMISLRAELARGDLRALYVAWLLLAQTGELADEDTEPAVPPGLGQLNAALTSLVEFLRVDTDLLHVAAQASTSLEPLDKSAVRKWVAKLPTATKDDVITDLIVDGDQAAMVALTQRFHHAQHGSASVSTPRRTVGRLLAAAEAYTTARRAQEAAARALEEVRRASEAAIARARYLEGLVGHEERLWKEVNTLVATKQAQGYDRAERILMDLQALAARGHSSDFALRLEALRQTHARKQSFIDRLRKRGL